MGYFIAGFMGSIIGATIGHAVGHDRALRMLRGTRRSWFH